MSVKLAPAHYTAAATDFKTGEYVSFSYKDARLRGIVVQRYIPRGLYIVQCGEERYEVDICEDSMRKESV